MKIFDDYVKNYDFNIDGIKLKYDHSYRVQKIEEELAKSLKLNENDIKLASICGLFHDIARFEQLRKYNTFDDHLSFDHGDLGYEIIKKDIIDKLALNEEEKNILLISTKYHNKYTIDNNLGEKTTLFCKLIRDADKIDILNLFSKHLIAKDLINGDTSVSINCHNSFMNHKQVSWKDVKTKGDRILVYLALIWDLNFKRSFEIIEERKLLAKAKKVMNLPAFDTYFQMLDKKIMEEIC